MLTEETLGERVGVDVLRRGRRQTLQIEPEESR
jgi:hypothetical protein